MTALALFDGTTCVVSALRIDLRRYGLKVLGPQTVPCSAYVVDLHPRWDGAEGDLVRDSVSQRRPVASDTNAPVAVSGPAGPQPACIRLLDLRPQSVVKRRARREARFASSLVVTAAKSATNGRTVALAAGVSHDKNFTRSMNNDKGIV